MSDWRKYWDVSKGVNIDKNFPCYVFDSNMQTMLDVEFENIKSSFKFEVKFLEELKKLIDGEQTSFFKDNFEKVVYDNVNLLFFTNDNEYVFVECRGYGFLQYRCEFESEIIEIQDSLMTYIAESSGLNIDF